MASMCTLNERRITEKSFLAVKTKELLISIHVESCWHSTVQGKSATLYHVPYKIISNLFLMLQKKMPLYG